MFNTTFIIRGAHGVSFAPAKAILLEKRKIYIDKPLDSESVSDYIQQIMILSQQSKEPITLLINTPGGSIQEGLALTDVMKGCGCIIKTYAIGMAASMGAIILAAGTKGHRYATQHSRVMIHEPLLNGGLSGSCSTIQAHAKLLLERKELICKLLSEYTGKNKKEVEKAISYDHYMSCEEAKEFGLIDNICNSDKLEFI